MTEDDSRNIPAYIAREKCGCVVAATVDNPDRKDGRVETDLIEWINDGLIIERVTVGWVRDHGLERCNAHKVEQLEFCLGG